MKEFLDTTTPLDRDRPFKDILAHHPGDDVCIVLALNQQFLHNHALTHLDLILRCDPNLVLREAHSLPPFGFDSLKTHFA